MLELHVLGSGKGGCCYAVRPQGEQEFVCVDCGLVSARFHEACKQACLMPFKLQAFLITHAHGDQVKGLKSTLKWLGGYDVKPPVYVAPSVLEASRALKELAGAADVRELEALRPLDIAHVHVLPFRTFHDNEDEGGCYNFRFEEVMGAQGRGEPDSMAILSDAGVVSKQASSALERARLIAVECNYDSETLKQARQAKATNEGKPSSAWAVKVRGNFSNEQAATVVRGFAWEGLRDVVAMHLSATYNTPELAICALEKAVRDAGCDARVACSSGEAVVSVLPQGTQAQAMGCDGDDGDGPKDTQAASAGEQAEMGVQANPAEPAAEPEPETPDIPAGPVAQTSGKEPASEPSDGASASSQAEAAPSAPVEAGPEPASEEPQSPTADDPTPAQATFEDILALPQALEAGMASAEGLLAAWEAQGLTCNPTPDELIDALAAFGLLDPQDLSPTEAGVAAGIWVAFDPDDPAGALRPVFSLAQAGGLRALIEG